MQLAEGIIILLITVLLYLSLYVILFDSNEAIPGGNIFSLFVVFITAILAGKLVELIKLPGLLGMLIAGILLRSVPGIKIIGDNIDPIWSSTLRLLFLK